MRLVSFSMLCSILIAFGMGTAMATPVSDASRALSSADYLEATEATRVLFKAGEVSIPFLVANLSDTSLFSGLCGNQIRQSQADFMPLESMENEDRESEEDCATDVRDISLYLILAILKDDFYFAEDCKPVVDLGDRYALSLACGEVAVLFVRGQTGTCEFSLDAIENILHQHGIVFPPVPGTESRSH